jgi:type VI secretion system secreted protein VgrG
LYTSGASHIAETYHGTYEFLPKKQTFRALAHTPKPRIYGIQTAKVVPKKNEDGEEISTDKYGRVSVQFHWDNEPKKSCPIRVAQVWAGNNWGGIFIPRVGMEVVLEFLEGDPDRPLIVGCVYNADNEVPYELPDKKTKAGWKSQSSKGGSGYNELVFDDDAGHEKIGMHAERDHEVVIRNMQKVEIGENFQSMGNAREVTLKAGNDKLTLDTGSRKVEIAMNDHLSVGVSITLECGASRITMNSSSIMLNSPLISLNGAMVKINGGP